MEMNLKTVEYIVFDEADRYIYLKTFFFIMKGTRFYKMAVIKSIFESLSF